jgi:hypothetical protein
MVITGTAANLHLRAASRQRPRVELLSPCSRLDMDTPQQAGARPVNRRRQGQPPPRHFETGPHADPMQNRLSSAFVAQILGQDLVTKRQDPEPARRAYAQAQRPEPAPHLLRLV